MEIKENFPLKNLNTFKVGGNARYFAEAKSISDIKELAGFSESKKIPIFVLGGGSNIIFPDDVFPYLVIKNCVREISFKKNVVECGAGEDWDNFVLKTIKKKLYGLENLSGIPGTVGASPVQNIGAYGVEVKDYIFKVETFNLENKKTKVFSNKDCQFLYRDSFFKNGEGKKYVITKVIFKLKKDYEPHIEYKDLKIFFGNKIPKPIELRNAVLDIRKSKLPDLKKYGTAGSFFKNPVISKSHFNSLKDKYPKISGYEISTDKIKVSAGFLIDKVCGLRGLKKNNVGIFEKHSLVLVNLGGATAKELKNFSEEIKKVVKDKTKISLEEEVSFL